MHGHEFLSIQMSFSVHKFKLKFKWSEIMQFQNNFFPESRYDGVTQGESYFFSLLCHCQLHALKIKQVNKFHMLRVLELCSKRHNFDILQMIYIRLLRISEHTVEACVKIENLDSIICFCLQARIRKFPTVFIAIQVSF